MTVSRVINNAPSVRENNRQKVLQAMKELNYIPNSAARSLARGKTGTIGLILTTLQDSVFEGIVREVNEELEYLGYFLALSIVPSTGKGDQSSNYLFQRDRVDGVILLSSSHEAVYVKELRAKGIPYVLIDNHDLASQATMIQVDNYQGGYMAAQHLLHLGHTRIGYIYGPEHLLSARERRQGFEQALADNEVEPVIACKAQFDMRDGFRIAQDWIERGIELTAISAADDFLAWGVIQAYQDAGFKVPQDLSVIGYDDQDFASKTHPSLTTVQQPTDSMGKEAVKRLLTMLSDIEDSSAPGIDQIIAKRELIKLMPKLLVRDSTSPSHKE